MLFSCIFGWSWESEKFDGNFLISRVYTCVLWNLVDCSISGYTGSISGCSNMSRRLEKVRFGFRFTEIGDCHTQLRNRGFKLKSNNQLAYLVFSINIAGSSMSFLDLGSWFNFCMLFFGCWGHFFVAKGILFTLDQHLLYISKKNALWVLFIA